MDQVERKTLDEIADFYLNLSPVQIPDSGFCVSGISGRFPDADNIDELWENLLLGRDMITGPDDKRWPLGLWGLPHRAGRIKGISRFDNEFFGIPKEQADYTDHQLRILLEVIYESLLDAGINPAKVRGDKRCGISFGFHTVETELEFEDKTHYQTTGYRGQLLAAITSYFDIRGSASVFDAACASSLVAFHEAVVALRAGLLDTVIVCGVNISIKPTTAYRFLELQMISPTGASKFLDASANGYVKSEACVSVVLQRKDLALRSYASIVHTKTNCDGYTLEGITYPSRVAQVELMEGAIKEAGLEPRQVVFVEAHGTGTPVGDHEEARAIAEAYCKDREQPLLIGSVKSNMGHTEGMSGLCALAKLLYIFENQSIPTNLNYEKPNPSIKPLVDGRLRPVTKSIPFTYNMIPMNCYGFGGVNVNAILKADSRDREVSAEIVTECPRLITMFGRSQAAVETFFRKLICSKDKLLTRDYLALIDAINEGPIDRLMNYRGYLLVDKQLNEIGQSVVKMNSDHRDLWFVLPGLGSQWQAMGRHLVHLAPVWSRIKDLASVLRPFGVDLIDILTNEQRPVFEDNVVSLFTSIVAIQVALIDLLALINVKPTGIVGHSIGEISCAYADGLLSADESILLAYHLAKPIDLSRLHKGAMAAVGLSAQRADYHIQRLGKRVDSVQLACINGAESVTVSGQQDQIDELCDMLREEHIYARRIADVKTAFHCGALKTLEQEMVSSVKRLFNKKSLSKNWHSTVHGQGTKQFQVDAKYFVENLCSKVLFDEVLTSRIEPERSIIIELGPHALFEPNLKQKYTYVSLMRRGDGSINNVLTALGQLYQLGKPLSLAELYPDVQFPVARGTGSISSIIRWNHEKEFHVAKFPEAFSLSASQSRVCIDLNNGPDSYLADHCIDGRVLFPAFGYITLVWRSFSLLIKDQGDRPTTALRDIIYETVEFHDVRIHRATILGSVSVELKVRIDQATGEFEIMEGDNMVVNGYVMQPKVRPSDMLYDDIKLEPSFKDKPMELKSEDIYKSFRVNGYDYGKSFRNITAASQDGQRAQVKWNGQYVSFLDSVLQCFILAAAKERSGLFLPTSFDYIRINPTKLQSIVSRESDLFDVYCEPETSIIVTDGFELRGLGVKPAARRLQLEPLLESYQFVPHLDIGENPLIEAYRKEVNLYKDMCSTAVHKIMSNLQYGHSLVLLDGQRLIDDETFNRYIERHESSERHALIRILDRILASQEEESDSKVRQRVEKPKLKRYHELTTEFKLSVERAFEGLHLELDNDLLSFSFHHEPFLRPLLEIAFENTNSQRIKLLELNPGDDLKHKSVMSLMSRISQNLRLDYYLAHANAKSIAKSPQNARTFNWVPGERISNGELRDLDVVLYTDSSCYPALETESQERDLVGALESAVGALRLGGFLLVFLRTELSLAECFLYKLNGRQLNQTMERLEVMYEAAECAKLTLVAEKIDRSTGNVLLLYRKLDTSIELKNQDIIRINHEQHDKWLEPLKSLMREVKPNGNIWLLATGSQYHGVMGFFNCLRREPGGERLRMLLDQRSDESLWQLHHKQQCTYKRVHGDETLVTDVFVDLDKSLQDDETNHWASRLVDLMRRDLIYNCLDDSGSFGSFRHLDVSKLIEDQRVDTEDAHVNQATRGDLSSFRWYESPYKYIDQREKTNNLVEIYYSALNFKDIMLASGRLPLEALPRKMASSDCILGLEFSGRTQSGTRLAGLTESRSIATNIMSHQNQSICFRLPDSMSLEEGATIAAVYATAVMALITRGNIREGESILIHSGSGGVGQAAIRLCLHHKLTVYTTVGNQEKRDFLKREFPQLTDDHIFNSRDCSFESDVMRATNGLGVDLVLNSLSEDKLQASVRCLKDGGRFLEIGKYDMAVDSKLQLTLLDTNKTFHSIMLDMLFDADTLTDASRRQRDQMVEIIERGLVEGYIKPIKSTVFDKSQVEEAFRFMSSGKHIGKVLIKMRDEEVSPEGRHLIIEPKKLKVQAKPKVSFDPKLSYIITGGLGGFGLELAKWMVAKGARHLVLTSRSGAKTGYQRLTVEQLRNFHGVKVLVTDTTEAERLIGEACQLAPLGGIFNLAMVLRDSLFENMTVEQFDEVCLSKVKGVTSLDRASRLLCPDLAWFVCFSSVSCGKGNASQANYGYANSVMERICEARRRDNLHGLAIQWGPIGDVGVAFENFGETNELVISGFMAQRLPSCFTTLEKLLSSPFAVCLSLIPAETQSIADRKGDPVKAILHVLGIKDPSTIDPNSTLVDLGMDSLMGVEIRQALERDYDVSLTAQEIRSLRITDIRNLDKGKSSAKKSSDRHGDVVKRMVNYKTESGHQLAADIPNLRVEMSSNGELNLSVDKTLVARDPLVLPADDLILLNAVSHDRILKGDPIFVLPGNKGDFSRLSLVLQRLTRPCLGVCWTKRMAQLSNMADVAHEHLQIIHGYYPSLEKLDLIGYSFGAALAVDMMLEVQRNETKNSPLKAGKLVLLDCSPEALRNIASHANIEDKRTLLMNSLIAYLMQHSQFDYFDVRERLLSEPRHEKWISVATYLLAWKIGIEDKQDIDQLSLAIEAHYRRNLIILNYDDRKPMQLNGDAFLLRATEISETFNACNGIEEDYGLSKIISGQVNSYLFKGNHESFIDNNVDQISSLIGEIL